MDGAEITAPLTRRAPLRCWIITACFLPLLALAMAGDRTHPFFAANKPSGVPVYQTFRLRPGLAPGAHLTANIESASPTQLIALYGELIGRVPGASGWKEDINDLS